MTGACVFCGIVEGRLEASLLYDDQRVVAFMDLNPITPGHLLVIPKAHAASLDELDAEDGAQAFRVAQRLAAAVRASGLRSEGVNLFLADGEAAGQEVFHVHLHVFPRTPGDGFRIDADWRVRPRAELDESAERVRSGLAATA